MTGMEAYEVYEKGGMIGLFVVMYVTTIWFTLRLLLKDKEKLIKDREKEVERTKAMAEIVVKATVQQERGNDLLEKLQETLDLEVRKSTELMTYFKARDDAMKGGRR